MRFVPKVTSLASALGMAVLLSGCATYDSATSALGRGASSVFQGIADLGGSIAPWGTTRPASPGDSLTVQRVRGVTASADPLLPEEGNVWPAPEAPRATLMNPDQALRGISSYPTPAALSEPAPRRGTTGGQGAAAMPPVAQGGQPVQTPQGAIVPSTDSTFNSPTGGGTITRDGNTTIINRPGEPPQIIQNPR